MKKNRNLLRLRVFDPPRLAPYLLEMGGQPLKSNLKKKAKNPSDHLAKMVIRSCWPVRGSAEDKSNMIEIRDVSAGIFHHLLFHLYWDDLKCHAKEIIYTGYGARQCGSKTS